MKKKLTISKLELLGNFILSNLIEVVFTALSEEIRITGLFFWSDSTTSLVWIKVSSQ